MSNYIHPITLDAALYVASHLRDDDYREVKEGHGHEPLLYIPQLHRILHEIHLSTAPESTASHDLASAGQECSLSISFLTGW